MRPLIVLAVFLLTVGVSEAAPVKPTATKQVLYLGVHPLPGAAFCEIEGPHVHIFEPENAAVLYRVHDGRYVFVGDPAPFGYTGTKYAYYGHHPIILEGAEIDSSFCYLDGPHYHHVAAPSRLFVARGGASWYVGPWPAVYKKEARRYTKINVIYEPLLYARPVVTVTPPPEYRPPVIDVVVNVRHSRAVVAPRFEVRVPVVHHYDVYYYRRSKKKHHHHHDHD